MSIILDTGNFTPDFSGSPIVEAEMAQSPVLDLSLIQDLKLTIETTGAHKDIKVQFKNNDNRYAEFNMGGNKEGTPEAETRTQTLTAGIDAVTYTENDGIDFDATNISEIKVLFEDDGNVTGISSANKATVKLENSSSVANTLEVCRGFKTKIKRKITSSSTALYLETRPFDKNTKQPLIQFGVIVSDNAIVDVMDQTPEKVSETYGEWFWVKFESTDPNKGDHRHSIVQRGGAEPSYPPALGNFKKSLQIEHEDENSAIIALDQGKIEEGITAAGLLVADIQQQQTDFEAGETQARTTFETAQTDRQDDFEADETAARTAYQTALTAQQTAFEQDSTNVDNELKKWTHGQFPLSELDAAYANVVDSAKVEYTSGDILYFVKTQKFLQNVNDGIVKILNSDGVSVLRVITKDNTTGITTQSNPT